MSDTRLTHCFVESIPEKIEPWSLYVSVEFATVMHLCLCGCGREVVTPLSPTDWKMTFDGESITLYPSIGNWSFSCRSHYWIRHNRVEWAGEWSEEEVARGRREDRITENRSLERKNSKSAQRVLYSKTKKCRKTSAWTRIKLWLGFER